jgi:diacylglycerol kinase family enzyme
MRLLIIHNPDAGHEDLPRHLVIDRLQRAGHEVVWVDKDPVELGEISAEPFDALVVAGGDGSVARAGRMLAGRGIPIAILPSGTANNIASIVGATPDNLLQLLARGRTVPFDIGTLESPVASRRFLEGIGLGAFAEAAAMLGAHTDGPLAPDGREAELARDRQVLGECVGRSAGYECRLALDDTQVVGTWLLVEVTNAGVIGPNLRLSGDAVPYDGLLDVVTVDVTEREALLAFVRAHQRQVAVVPPLTVHRARRVTLGVPANQRFHIDGETLESPEPLDLRIGIEPGALRFFAR